MYLNRGLLKHVIFWLFFLTAFWGAFEQAYNAPGHPVWSATWSLPFPVPHHYIVGFLGLIGAYILFTMDDWKLHETVEDQLEIFRKEILKVIKPKPKEETQSDA
jgi:hypothetical protein